MRRLISPLLLCGLLLHTSLLWSQDATGLAPAHNLQQDGRLAARRGLPILLMITQDHCPYCALMKREVLRPMQLSGEYTDRVILRELHIDQGLDIIDFQGQRQDAAALAHHYGADLTPTLLLLGPQGKELSPRIVGINTVEMFSFYLDAAIDEAAQKLRRKLPDIAGANL